MGLHLDPNWGSNWTLFGPPNGPIWRVQMDPQNGPSGAGANDPQPKGNSKGPEDTLPPMRVMVRPYRKWVVHPNGF